MVFVAFAVIPAKAGIQYHNGFLDSRLRGSDGVDESFRILPVSCLINMLRRQLPFTPTLARLRRVNLPHQGGGNYHSPSPGCSVWQHGKDRFSPKRLRPDKMATGDRGVARRAKTGLPRQSFATAGGFGAVPLGFATDAPRGSAGNFTPILPYSNSPLPF